MRRHRGLRQHDIGHRAQPRRTARQQQHVAIVVPDHLAQVRQDRAERRLDHGFHAPRIGRDLDIRNGKAARAGLARGGLEEGDGARIGRLRFAGEHGADRGAEDLAHLTTFDALVGVQHAKPDRLQHLRDELTAQVAFHLALPATIAAERLPQEGLRVGHAGGAQRIGHLRQHEMRDEPFQHLVARDLEALAEFLARHDGVAVLHAPGHHHQVRGAAADVDGGHAKAGIRPAFRPHAPGEFEEPRRIALQPLGDLGVEPDHLRRRRLVEVQQHARFGRRGRPGLGPAEQVPGELHRALGPFAQDLLFRQRHCRRQREDHAPQPPRHVGEAARRARGRRIDLADRLHQQFRQQEGEHRGP